MLPVGGLARDLSKKVQVMAMEGPLSVKVPYKPTKLLEKRKQEMWYVKKCGFIFFSISCKLRMLAISLPLFQ